MYVIIGFSDSEMYEGVVLAAGSNRLRIALRDGNDALELRRSGRQWKSEDGRPVELESVVYSADLSRFAPVHAPFRAA